MFVFCDSELITLELQQTSKHAFYGIRQHAAFASGASEIQWQAVGLHPWDRSRPQAETFPLTLELTINSCRLQNVLIAGCES